MTGRPGGSGWVQAVALFAVVGGVVGGALLLRQVPEEDLEVAPTRLFEQVLSHVRRYGVDSLGESELFRLAADGLVRELDDEFATLIPAGGAVDLHADAGGLGLRLFSRQGRMGVLGVLPDSPARRAGIRPGDELLEIDEAAAGALGFGRTVAMLNDEPGTPVRLRIRRPGLGQVMEYRVARDRARQRLMIGPVELGPGTWYIALPNLGTGSARALRVALRGLPADARLVLDLRGASGGELEEAVGLAGLFLAGDLPVVRVTGRDTSAGGVGGRGETVHRSGRSPAQHSGPVVVLVDGGTADAGEVVAGAIQDHDRGVVVGTRTFGRGMSQRDFPLTDRWTVRISTGRWETPLGRQIQRDLSASTPDDSAESPPPTVVTAGGRELPGGGAIRPDSLVAPDPVPVAALALLRAMGAGVPAFDSLLRATAVGMARETPGIGPDWRPDRRSVLAFRSALAERLVLEPQLVEAAEGYLGARLAELVVAEALGPEGTARQAAGADPVVRMALRLLAGASTSDELVLGRP